MSGQGFDKVDLSLDEIIKLNRKEKKQQNRGRGGAIRGGGRGGAVRGGGVRGRGRGLRGQRARGGGRGGAGGVSPLNRQKLQTGTISATQALRGQGQGVRGRGQRGTRRGVVGTRGGLRGGLTRGYRGGGRGQVRGAGSIRNNNRGNLRGGLIRGRGTQGNLRGTLRGRGNQTNRGRGWGLINQGQGRGTPGQGQGRGGANRLSLKQKRIQALKTLRQARNMITQLDQQTARQNFVNVRRGLVQQSQQLTTKKNQGLYSSNMSLNPTQASTSLTSARQLQGTQVTTFNPVRSQQSLRGRRRWRTKTQTNLGNLPINNGSTLTISIDNTSPVSTTDLDSPQAPVPSGSQQRQRQRRRPWRRQNPHTTTPAAPAAAAAAATSGNVDYLAGATPEFSQQLMNMKPTVSTKYVFEKGAFATANTSCSLNDRFSGTSSGTSSEVLVGRKVFL